MDAQQFKDFVKRLGRGLEQLTKADLLPPKMREGWMGLIHIDEKRNRQQYEQEKPQPSVPTRETQDSTPRRDAGRERVQKIRQDPQDKARDKEKETSTGEVTG